MKFQAQQKNYHFFLYLLSSALAFFLLHSFPAGAAEITFTPTLRVSETYTDNVRLGGFGFGGGGFGLGRGRDGGSDFITQINPGLLVNGTGKRFDINAQYTMNNLIYANNSNLTRIRHRLNASATTELLKDHFFIEGRSSISQWNTNLLGPQTTDNILATGNRRTIQFYSVSPYFIYQFGNFASTELRYTRGILKSGVNGFRDSQRDSYQFSLNSGDKFRKLAWGFDYSNQMIHFNRFNRKIELERSIANLRYNVNSRFGLTASGGYERNSFISIRGKPSSPTWTVGFDWAPNTRTDLRFSVGQRFFGDTYAGELNYRTRLSTWRILYAEDITTLNQQGGRFGSFGALDLTGFGFPNPQQVLGLSNFLTNRVFLQKRFNASVAINGSRNDLVFSVFHLSRIPYSAEEVDAELLGSSNLIFFRHTRQRGGNMTWRYRFTPDTNFSLNFSLIRFDFLSANRRNDNSVIAATISKKFGPDLSGSLQYRRIERISNIQSGNQGQSFDLSGNMVTVTLSKTF